MEVGHHVVSLSLGTVAEPSALAVVQPRPERETHFDVTWLERFPAGRPILAMVNRVMEIVGDTRKVRDYTLLLDITSVGRAPLRVFEARGIFAGAIELTNAESEGYTNGVQRVPLRDVVGAAQVILQTARLQVASGLELAETLVTDLIGFDPKPVARDMDLRGGRNADLVLALAVALWWGDRFQWDDEMLDRYAADMWADYEQNPVSGY